MTETAEAAPKAKTKPATNNTFAVEVEYDELSFVRNYVCPSCHSEKLKLNNVDSIGTTFFRCEKCGQISHRLKSVERAALEKEVSYLRDIKRGVRLSEVEEILDSTIKHDTKNKLITFLAMLLTFTEEDQVNVSLTAESSTGKSYIPLEIAWYFPKNNVIEFHYVSPTAFFHEHGVLLPDPTDTRDVEDKEKRKIIHVNLKRKILIFIDQPHDLLLRRLRPLLSHDRPQLVSKITDRRERCGLRTKTVVIEGFPSVFFCTAKSSLEEQERTRLLLLSPDMTQAKIRDSILLRIEREGDREKFREFMESDYRRNWLRDRVHAIAQAKVRNIIIPEELRDKIAEKFLKRHNTLIPRHQRDISRVLALIKAVALLSLWERERIGDSILVNENDVEEGYQLYLGISAANELGLPPETYNIYAKLVPQISEEGITLREFQKLYYKTFHRVLGKRKIDEIVGLLESAGLIACEPDPNDRRRKLLLPTGQRVFISEDENNGSNSQNRGAKINTSESVGKKNLVFADDSAEALRNCWVCRHPLPRDLRDCTVLEGRQVHLTCYLELTKGWRDAGG